MAHNPLLCEESFYSPAKMKPLDGWTALEGPLVAHQLLIYFSKGLKRPGESSPTFVNQHS